MIYAKNRLKLVDKHYLRKNKTQEKNIVKVVIKKWKILCKVVNVLTAEQDLKALCIGLTWKELTSQLDAENVD